jgi:hypothetical protein
MEEPQKLKPSKILFLGEQNGMHETVLKGRLTTIFEKNRPST